MSLAHHTDSRLSDNVGLSVSIIGPRFGGLSLSSTIVCGFSADSAMLNQGLSPSMGEITWLGCSATGTQCTRGEREVSLTLSRGHPQKVSSHLIVFPYSLWKAAMLKTILASMVWNVRHTLLSSLYVCIYQSLVISLPLANFVSAVSANLRRRPIWPSSWLLCLFGASGPSNSHRKNIVVWLFVRFRNNNKIFVCMCLCVCLPKVCLCVHVHEQLNIRNIPDGLGWSMEWRNYSVDRWAFGQTSPTHTFTYSLVG